MTPFSGCSNRHASDTGCDVVDEITVVVEGVPWKNSNSIKNHM
jgi:hypothetical protein